MSLRGEVARFGVVGVVASAVHVAVALIADRWLEPLGANALAFCVALTVSYLGNARVTFKVEPRPGDFARFAAVSLAAFGLNQAIVYALTERLGWPLAWSLMVVVTTVPAFTFVMARGWALRRR